MYSKPGLLSLHPQCPHAVPEAALLLLSLRQAEEPACTLPGHDAIQLLFATHDGFLEECSTSINCPVTESYMTQKLFSYLALQWSGNFYNEGKIINHIRSYCSTETCALAFRLCNSSEPCAGCWDKTGMAGRVLEMQRGACDPAATAFQPGSFLLCPKRLTFLFLCKIPGRNPKAAGKPMWASRDVVFLARGVHMSSSCFTPKTGWSVSRS